jgi:hypothetical protein
LVGYASSSEHQAKPLSSLGSVILQEKRKDRDCNHTFIFFFQTDNIFLKDLKLLRVVKQNKRSSLYLIFIDKIRAKFPAFKTYNFPKQY